MIDRISKPPNHLSLASRALWKRIHAEYELEAHHDALLCSALESRDRAEQARQLIDADGPLVDNPRGGKRPHPLLGVERDSRAAWVRTIHALGFDEQGTARTAVERTLHGRQARWDR